MAKAMSKQESVLKVVRETTLEWAKDTYAVEDKQTAKAKKLSAALTAISGIGGEDKDRLALIISEVSGEDVKVEKDEELDMNQALLALMVTKAPTDKHKHTYETDKLIITIGDGAAVGHDGKVGSMIPPKRAFVRPATEAEMKDIPEAQIKGLLKEVNIVFA